VDYIFPTKRQPAEMLQAMGGVPADVVFDCAGFEATVETALETAASGGIVVLIGMGCTGRTMQVPLLPAAIREVSLVGSFRYRNTYATCLSLIASGRIDVKALITHRIDLAAPGALTVARVEEGFKMAERGREVIKVMFHL
jgi:L-iditol 2-dehydrogenase